MTGVTLPTPPTITPPTLPVVQKLIAPAQSEIAQYILSILFWPMVMTVILGVGGGLFGLIQQLRMIRNQLDATAKELERYDVDPTYKSYGSTMKNQVITNYNNQVTQYNNILSMLFFGRLLQKLGYTKLPFKDYVSNPKDVGANPFMIQQMQ